MRGEEVVMILPTNVNFRWISSLGIDQLIEAEALLHAEFLKEETAEKQRTGAKYKMLRGPESLVCAWNRWLLVSNAARTRRVVIHRGAKVHA